MTGLTPSPTPLAGALILVAGRGERMRPLTDQCPKPLLRVQGKPLMEWTAEALARGGCARVAVNTAWLEERISAYFGDQFRLESPESNHGQLSFSYSPEGRDFGRALETLGGVCRALPLLDDPFWVVAGDVFMPEFAFTQAAVARFAASGMLAHLWLVPNPPHKPQGDFAIAGDGQALDEPRHTFSTVALYRRALFEPPWCEIPFGNPWGVAAPIAPLLRRAIAGGRVSAELYNGPWTDVGTPERLAALQNDAFSHLTHP